MSFRPCCLSKRFRFSISALPFFPHYAFMWFHCCPGLIFSLTRRNKSFFFDSQTDLCAGDESNSFQSYRAKQSITCVHQPDIHFLYSICAAHGRRGSLSLSDQSASEKRGTPWTVHHWANTETNRLSTPTQCLPVGILELQIYLHMRMCGLQKFGVLGKKNANMGGTSKPLTERIRLMFKPFLLWGNIVANQFIVQLFITSQQIAEIKHIFSLQNKM